MTQTWLQYVAIMASIVVAFTCLKVATCKPFKEDGEEFKARKLILGFAKHSLVIAGISLVHFVCDMFASELILVTINGTEMTIQGALDVMMLAIIAFYGGKLIKEFVSYSGIDNPSIIESKKNELSDQVEEFLNDKVFEEDSCDEDDDIPTGIGGQE